MKISLPFLLFSSLFLVSATLSYGLGDEQQDYRLCKRQCHQKQGVDDAEILRCKIQCGKFDQERDPEFTDCKYRCETAPGAQQDEKLRCKRTCEQHRREKERRQERGGSGGEFGIVFPESDEDPREILSECQRRCQGEHPRCFQECMQKAAQHGGGSGARRQEEEKRGGGGEEERNNPYVFKDRHFVTHLENEHGRVRVLGKFTERSELFRGIENFRVAILEAEPSTFIVPNHWDADALVFVARGEGSISLNFPESRRSFNIKRGDIIRVPAGVGAYLVNTDSNERLVLAKILRSISVPGDLESFFSSGTGNSESSVFSAFSQELLEAAFNSKWDDQLERLFGGQEQEQGFIRKASEEQIKSLSQRDEAGIWPFKERKNLFNIFENRPSVQNDHGRLHEVDSSARSQLGSDLEDLNVAISFFNITQGSIAGPFYNTKATTVAVVRNGEGQFEMACPHLSEGSESGGGHRQSRRKGSGGGSPSYQKVSSRLDQGTVVVFPAGHPVIFQAKGNQNLELICFGLNSHRNEWFPLAGKKNVMGQWEDGALELAFGASATEVRQVIESQQEELFFEGPQRGGGGGRAFA